MSQQKDDPWPAFHEWRIEGEPLADVVARLVAEREAEKRRRVLPDLPSFVATDTRDPVRWLAAFLARHPHFARREASSCVLLCLPTLWHWYRYIDWACAMGYYTVAEAADMKERVVMISRLEIFGGPDLPLN